MRDNKSCKTCRFLHTDSFISPCAHCEDENHWVRASSIEEGVIDRVEDIETLLRMLGASIVIVEKEKIISYVWSDTWKDSLKLCLKAGIMAQGLEGGIKK